MDASMDNRFTKIDVDGVTFERDRINSTYQGQMFSIKDDDKLHDAYCIFCVENYPGNAFMVTDFKNIVEDGVFL